MKVHVGKGGVITLPKEVMAVCGITGNDVLECTVEDACIILKPILQEMDGISAKKKYAEKQYKSRVFW